MSCMHIMSMPIFYHCIKYCICCLLLVFCFFPNKALSWCEIRQVLRMCTASLVSGEHPLRSLIVASYLSVLPLYILSLCLRCFSISILFACYLAASYYPYPHPIAIVCLPVGLASPRHAQVVSSLFYQILYGYVISVTTSHDTLLLMLVWE